jgi:hypothetical protein
VKNPNPLLVPLCLLSLGAAACSKQEHPLTASSASEGTYALGYVDSLGAARGEEAAIESQVDAGSTALATYPDALSSPSWKDVLVVYQAADGAGRSSAYVEELEKDQAVAQFYVDEKDDMNRRVAGAAQYAAKQGKCDAEVAGPTAYALGKAFDESIRDRLHKHSDAYMFIDDNEEALGKRNRPKLEDQSDAISQTSYFVYVAAPNLRERLERQAGESSGVDRTLGKMAEDAHRVANDASMTAAQRAHAKDREQAANTARQRIQAEASETKKLSEEMDKRIKALRDKYEAAFDALEKDVKKRAEATPATKSAAH